MDYDRYITSGNYYDAGLVVTKCPICGYKQAIPMFHEYGGFFPGSVEQLIPVRRTAYFEDIFFCPHHPEAEMEIDTNKYTKEQMKALYKKAKDRLKDEYPWIEENQSYYEKE